MTSRTQAFLAGKRTTLANARRSPSDAASGSLNGVPGSMSRSTCAMTCVASATLRPITRDSSMDAVACVMEQARATNAASVMHPSSTCTCMEMVSPQSGFWCSTPAAAPLSTPLCLGAR